MPSKVRAPLGVWGRSGRAGVVAGVAAVWGWAAGLGAIGAVAWPGVALAVPQVQPPGEPEPGDAQPQPPDEKEPAQPGDEKAQPGQPGPGKAADLASEESLARFQQLLARRPFHGPAFNGLVNHYVERGKLPE